MVWIDDDVDDDVVDDDELPIWLWLFFLSFLLGLVKKKRRKKEECSVTSPSPISMWFLRPMMSGWIKYERVYAVHVVHYMYFERTQLLIANESNVSMRILYKLLKICFIRTKWSDILNQAPINFLSLYLLRSNNLFIISATIAAIASHQY